MIRKTALLFVFLPGLIASPLIAQSSAGTGAPNSASSADAGQVMIAANVIDKHGKLVSGLTKNDFTLTVDDKPQAVQSVTTGANLPLTVGLVEQTNLADSGALEAERVGSRKFLDAMLASSGDKAFVIQFDREVDLLADVSPNKTKLDAALDQLGAPQIHNTGAATESNEDNHRIGGSGTTLYDAIYLASKEVIAAQPGRKVLILVTDGVDRGSKVSLFTAIEAAQQANTAVYAIYLKGNETGGNNSQPTERHHRVGGMGYPGGGWPGGGNPGSGGGWPGGNGGGSRPTARPTEGSRTDGRKILEQVCGETGGHMFEADKKATIDQISSLIANELRASYILQFAPGSQSSYGGFHRIALTTKKGDHVEARKGYYSGD
jgi:VWFA-related protein